MRLAFGEARTMNPHSDNVGRLRVSGDLGVSGPRNDVLLGRPTEWPLGLPRNTESRLTDLLGRGYNSDRANGLHTGDLAYFCDILRELHTIQSKHTREYVARHIHGHSERGQCISLGGSSEDR